jgi:hypothetical protein
MIIILLALAVAGSLYLALRLPSSVQSMTEEEYAAYFAAYIMGMKQ